MEEINFDLEIRNLLEGAYQAALKLNKGQVYSPEQIKMMIVATNLESLAKTFLHADETEEATLDLKKVALGILGTIDWIKEDLV